VAPWSTPLGKRWASWCRVRGGACSRSRPSTIDRVVDQLLAKGRIPRAYVGLGMQRVRLDPNVAQSLSPPRRTGVIVMSVDAKGPAGRAGVMLGDVLTAWEGSPVTDVRDVMERLGPESVGTTVELRLIHAGVPTRASVIIAE
jgi:S1-C subfamily serine protease